MLLFPLGGLVALGSGVRQVTVGLASRQWLSVEGTVTQSFVESKEYTSDGRTRVSHTPKVLYQYVTDGVRHEGKRLYIGESGLGNYEDAMKVIAPYPVDARVAVYYDPGKPQNSVLKPGIYRSAWWLLGFGVFFLAISWLVILPQF